LTYFNHNTNSDPNLYLNELSRGWVDLGTSWLPPKTPLVVETCRTSSTPVYYKACPILYFWPSAYFCGRLSRRLFLRFFVRRQLTKSRLKKTAAHCGTKTRPLFKFVREGHQHHSTAVRPRVPFHDDYERWVSTEFAVYVIEDYLDFSFALFYKVQALQGRRCHHVGGT